jgi:phage shock protein A
VARVIEQSKSSAEAFIESVREDLAKERLEVEESVVATDINELQQQVDGLEQQVRTVRAAWHATGTCDHCMLSYSKR